MDGGVSLKFESYAPTAMTDTAKVTVRPFGSGALTVARKDIGGIPLELDLKRVTQAGSGVKAKFNIDRLVALIPVVGPFVDKLNRTSGGLLLDAYANTDAQISYDITTRFTTEYPHILERRLFGMEGGGSVALEDRQTFLDAYRTGASSVHAFRRHVLGGLESKTSKKQLERAICAAFKWGLELKTLKVFGAKGEFQLVGNVCRFRNARGRRQPAMKITLNEFGDWPPIRRIEGEFVGETELYLDMWIVKFKKKAKLFGIKFARELASEPSIAFTRMDISNSMLSPIGSPAVTVNPDDPATLIDNLYALARYAVSGGDESVLVFADIDPDSGGMILKAMTRDAAGGWGLPVTVSAAGGVVASDLISLPDGGHLLVWVEIDLDDLLDPFAASSLKYSVSEDGVNWETGTIAELDGVATSLDLVRVEDSVAVLFLEGADGPISTEFDLKAAVYSNGGMQGFSAQQAGPSWSGTQTLLDDAFIGEWEGVPTSGADGLAIVYTDANGDLHSLEWDGAISSGPFEVVGGVRDVVTASGPDGESFLAWSGVDGDIQLMRRGESGWENLGDPLTTGIADNLAVSLVATDGTDALLAAWTEGSERTSIYHAFIGTDGVLITEPADLTMNSIGSYHDLRIVPEDASGLATVLAKFDGAATQLRAFRVSADGGGGDNDSDGDGLDDIDELRIVDADPDDAIRSVGDVRATDDFDNDGFDNGTEIASLTDAADAGLFPAQAVSITADVPETLEDGLVPAVLVVERLGDIGQGLTVRYSVGGTATAGEDYSGLSGEVTIAAGNFSEAIQVRAVPDSLDEGVEDVVVTLEEDAAYEIVGERSATASILEEPFVGLSFDGWLALHFTEEEILDPFVTGRQIDGDEDGYPNVVEYAFLMNPHIPDRPNIVPRIVFDAGTGSRFLLIELDRPPDSPDVDYLFEASDNLVEWEPVDLAIDAVTEVEGGQRVDLRDDAPLEELGKRFIRIRVVGN